MALIGIPLEVLLQLLGMAAGIPIVFFAMWFILWVPKPAKACIKAKMSRKDIDIDVNEIGVLDFKVGKVEGNGVFSSSLEDIKFLFLNQESWIAKVFSSDKIKFIFSYSGKQVATNPETLAVLQFNQMYQEFKNSRTDLKSKNNDDLKAQFIIEKPEAAELFKKMQSHNANVLESAAEKKKKNKTLNRRIAILLDPRILQEYISQLLNPSQGFYVVKKAYNKGLDDGAAPFLKKYLPFILFTFIGLAVVAMAIMGSQPRPIIIAPTPTPPLVVP